MPFGLYLFIVVALLVLVIFLSSLIINKLINCNDEGQYAQLIVGLVASTLSFVLCSNAIMGSIANKINSGKKDSKDKKIAVSKYIKDFNNDVLEDLTFTRRIIKRTEDFLSIDFKFESSLQNQADNVSKFEKLLNENGKVFKEALLYSTATVFYTSNKLAGNEPMRKYAESVINSAVNQQPTISKYVKTIAGSEFFYEFRRMRIKVLNYFERMAIEYVNGLISEELIDVQFKTIISSIVSDFYYLIYTDEGLNSYPYLNVMLQKMQM